MKKTVLVLGLLTLIGTGSLFAQTGLLDALEAKEAAYHHNPAPPPPTPPPTPTKPSPPPTQSVPGPISLIASTWTPNTISDGCNVPMSNNGSGSLLFDIPYVPNFTPGTDQCSVNYLRTAFTGDLLPGSSIESVCNGVVVNAYCLVLTYQIVATGAPTVNWDLESGNNCTSNCDPGAFHFLLEHTGDQCLCTDGYRFWYDAFIPLEQGTFTLAAPITYAQWTGIYGEIDQGTFDAMLQRMGFIGVTCGGGYFFGHGCSVSGGHLQIVITSFAITTAGETSDVIVRAQKARRHFRKE